MFELHETLHENYGVCLWLVLAIVVFVVIVVIAAIHVHNQIKRDKKFNEQIDDVAEEQEA